VAARHTYVRSMDGWWRRDPFFIKYMAREATAIFVVIYAAILLVGVVRLAQGKSAFASWAACLRSEPAIVLHVLLLVAFLYHTYTWFSIMPKTMPPIVVDGKRLSAGMITGLGLAASVTLSAGLFLAVQWLAA
jgi:fumarate reductase subunit C